MYILAENVELYKEQQPNGAMQYYVIVNRKGEKEYITNVIIYNFLSNFIEANTLENVNNTYIKLTNASPKQTHILKEQLTGFFDELIKRRWIIDENKPIQEPNFEPRFAINQSIANYTITKVLANNDTTEVYLAKRETSSKYVVIKVLNAKKFSSKKKFEKYRDYFQNEYNFLKTFNSIYINKGIDLINEDGFSYIVLEHINGKSVHRYVRHNRLTTKQKLDIVLKMLKGFAIIHKSLIYHGDIHLGNVLVTQKQRVKIIDFGYSNHAVIGASEENEKPRNGGAHAFIPPERGLRSIKRKFSAVEQYQSEVYQIGLIIYYIFMKDLPFKAETWKTMVDEKQNFNIRHYQPFLKRRMPKYVRHIIIKTLENDPRLRYTDAQNLLNAWKKIMK